MPNIFAPVASSPLEGVGPGPLALAVGALDGRLSGLDKVGHDLHFRAGHVVALHDGQRVLHKGDLPQGFMLLPTLPSMMAFQAFSQGSPRHRRCR